MAERGGMVLLDLSDEEDMDRLNKLLEGVGVTFVHDIFGLPHAMAWPRRIRCSGTPRKQRKGKRK